MGLGAAVKEVWERVPGVEQRQSDAGERKTTVTPLGDELDFRAVPDGGSAECAAQADGGEPAAVCGDAGGAAGDQLHQGPDCLHGLADRGAARRVRGLAGDRAERAAALTRALETPNESDSFRTLIEQVIEDVLVGGFGAVEIETRRDADGRCGCIRWMERRSR